MPLFKWNRINRRVGLAVSALLGIALWLAPPTAAQIGGRTADQGPFSLDDIEDLDLNAGGVLRNWIADAVQGVDNPLAAIPPGLTGLILSPNQSPLGLLRWQVKERFGSISRGFGVPVPAVAGASTLDFPGDITAFDYLTFLGAFDKDLSNQKVQILLECYPQNPNGAFPKVFWNVHPTTGSAFLSATADLRNPDGINDNPSGLTSAELLGRTRFLYFLSFAGPVSNNTTLNLYMDDIRLVTARGHLGARTAADGDFTVDNAEDLDLFADGVERAWVSGYVPGRGDVLESVALAAPGVNLTAVPGQSPVGALQMTAPVSFGYINAGFGVPMPAVPAYSTLISPGDLSSWAGLTFYACYEPTLAGQVFSVILECYPQNGDGSFPKLTWNFAPVAGKTFAPVAIDLHNPNLIEHNPQSLAVAELLGQARFLSIYTFGPATAGTTLRLRVDDVRLTTSLPTTGTPTPTPTPTLTPTPTPTFTPSGPSAAPVWFAPEAVLLAADSGIHSDLLDLKNYITDDNTTPAQMQFSVVTQSHETIVQVSVTASGLVSAVVQPAQMGKSDVVFRARDLSGNIADTTIQFVVSGATAIPARRWNDLK